MQVAVYCCGARINLIKYCLCFYLYVFLLRACYRYVCKVPHMDGVAVRV